jgi:hypothetical protein
LRNDGFLARLTKSYVLVKVVGEYDTIHYEASPAGYMRPEQQHSRYPAGLILATNLSILKRDLVSIDDKTRHSIFSS